MTDDLIKMLNVHVEGVRHYLYLQIGKPLSKDLVSAPEIALDNLQREVSAAMRAVAQEATDTEYQRELFAAITKIDLATAVSHIRNWTCYIDDYHRQKYADLIEAQAKLIAHLVNTRAPSLPEGERRCQKCGSPTKGEEAYIGGEYWCHPCADAEGSR